LVLLLIGKSVLTIIVLNFVLRRLALFKSILIQFLVSIIVVH
jgi:hypothetical protein